MDLYFRMPLLSIGNLLWGSSKIRHAQSKMCASARVGNGLTVTRTEISAALGVAAVLALDNGALIGRALGRRLVGLLIVCGCILAVRTLAVGLAGSTAACPTAEAAVGEVVAAPALDGNVLGGRALI